MAPSTRTRKPLDTRQHAPAVASTRPLKLGKVSKTGATKPAHHKFTNSQKSAYEQAVAEREEEEQRKRVEARQRSCTKRKRVQSQDEEDERENDTFVLARRAGPVKKTKLQLLTPPHSQHSTDTEGSSPVTSKFSFRSRTTLAALPEAMQQLASLHSAFVKALLLHYAHNGLSTPAETSDLMSSMTRIWRKATVSQIDLQQMLAMYEIRNAPVGPSRTLGHLASPFKLVTSGYGFNVRTTVEFCSVLQTGSFREELLQSAYEQKLIDIFDISKADETCFTHCSKSAYPLLAIEIGTQTQTHRQKIASTRADILSKPSKTQTPTTSDLDLSGLSIADQMMDTTPVSVKSRTSSLFDRVRAKGVVNAGNAAPTPAQLTRRHAIGRVPEIVEFLRMKQSQKSASYSSLLSLDDLQDESSSVSTQRSRARASRRVSFSLTQIIREVRESVPVPVSAEEVQVVITMLATELPELGGWIKVFAIGSVVSVTLDGNGLAMSGREVGQLVEKKEQSRLG